MTGKFSLPNLPFGLDWQIARHTLLNWGLILTGMVLYTGLNALALILVARQVSPAIYGQYVAAYALASILVVLPGFGMDAWLLTQPRQSGAGSRELWFKVLNTRVALLLVWLVFMLGLTFFLPDSTYPPAVLWPTTFAVAFESVLLLAFSALRVQQRHAEVTLFQVLAAVALFLLALLLPGDERLVVYFATGRALITGFFVVILVIRLSKGFRPGAFSLDSIPSILASARSFFLAVLASNIYLKADVTLVSLFSGAAEAGIYGPAISTLQIFLMPATALFYFIVPILSRFFLANEAARFKRVGNGQIFIHVLTGALISVGLFLFAPQIVLLVFGEAYAETGIVLRWLSIIPVIRGFNFGFGAMLTSSKRQPQRARVQAFVATFNIVANIAVIRTYGLVGVASVFIISELLLCLSYGWVLWRVPLDHQEK